ncbi:putative mfs drug efflux pump [Limtongia smithiae]|uniref:putative mfs drug efflux pump n=1 Tax=Limtongia smithiae TaxID=1125753 RepID=UPI0034CEB562
MTDKTEQEHDERALPLAPEITLHENDDDLAVKLGWRSWMVVFVACFVIMTQVFVVTAAGSVLAFIEADIGDASIGGWIIQGPLLMQSVLSPIIGRLSDVLDRKYLASVPPLIAFIGAVVSARATSMSMLIGGGVLIGVTLSTISIIQAIPAEVLPLKYRALANGFAFLGGAVAGLAGGIGAGAVTNMSSSGWRNIFWMQAAFHATSTIGLFAFYHPHKSDYPKMKLKEYIWTCDPIGSTMFISSTTLILLALDWAGGTYAWSSLEVALPLAFGLALLLVFCVYEWKGRDDGLVAHVFFRGSPNFALSIFAFSVEGWIFYSAVNTITPQVVLYLGFESTSWMISVRQLSYTIVALVASIPITLYATRYKDLKSPLLFTFALFLAVTIAYANIKPSWSSAQYVLNVICGIGQAGPLTLLVACVQFTAPHAFLSTATGLAFSARAIGGAFGSAVLDAIVDGKLGSIYDSRVTAAAESAGLPSSQVAALLATISSGEAAAYAAVADMDATIWNAAITASHDAYAAAYRLAWVSIVPFVVLAIVAVACLRGVKDLMTDKVEASVEVAEVVVEEKGV